MKNIIELTDIDKCYPINNEKLHVVKKLNMRIAQGEFILIMGKSGSGKTTLMNLLGLLDSFDNGKYIFDGRDITNITEKEKSQIRNNYMGFVFQQFHLIESLTIKRNIELPLLYKGHVSYKEREALIDKYLTLVDLIDKKQCYPSELSGGQQQRIAIARALICDPYIVFADEPTGALDSETSKDIMELMLALNKTGKTIVMVTHDEDLIKYSTRVIKIRDGLIEEG